MREFNRNEIQNLLDTGRSFEIIDCRDHSAYQRGHLPKAQYIDPVPSFEAAFSVHFPNKNTTYVFYGEDSNTQAVEDLIRRISSDHYVNLFLYREGYQGWMKGPGT